MLAAAQPVTEAEWTNILNDAAIDKSGYSFGDYQNYHNKIYDRYAISYGVSEDAGKILDEIKNGSQSRYELMKNLEAYLREMEYSTVDGALPDSVCDSRGYLDYFLLTSQKGYCMSLSFPTTKKCFIQTLSYVNRKLLTQKRHTLFFVILLTKESFATG